MSDVAFTRSTEAAYTIFALRCGHRVTAAISLVRITSAPHKGEIPAKHPRRNQGAAT